MSKRTLLPLACLAAPIAPDIDPRTGKIDQPIDLGGEPEFLAADGTGRVFVNLMNTNEVAVVDVRARKVVRRWPVAPGGRPVGMAMDTAKKRLFIGCRQPRKLLVMSAVDGKVLSDLPIGETVDATKVDGGQVFASTADGALSIAAETSPDKYEMVQTVKTARGARTMGVDAATHRIYLPTAEFEERKPGSTGRPAAKPGTFMILVVARKSVR